MNETATKFPRARWRLLVSGLSDGATNMAIDESLLLSVAKGETLPTIRFYGWQPPCVSVGYAQRLCHEIDLEECRRLGYEWVRRPTGGRAVLHIDELTYSVVAPSQEPRVSGDIVTSYRRLSRGLVTGLRIMGCEASQATYQNGMAAKPRSAACFDVPSHYEVTAMGKKLVGSAQVRRKGVVLQHGALPLWGDVARLAAVLRLEEEERLLLRSKLSTRAITLESATGQRAPFDRVAEAISLGFAQSLNLDLEPDSLTLAEREQAAHLRVRYRSDEWTFAR